MKVAPITSDPAVALGISISVCIALGCRLSSSAPTNAGHVARDFQISIAHQLVLKIWLEDIWDPDCSLTCHISSTGRA